MEPVKVTPMMQQYLQIKERYRDAILFFRLGDFYEMFFEDAHTAAKILDIALTSRNKNEDSSVPLCGVPYHAAEPYIQKLLDAGHKVAVCEQVEDPATAKGVVKREVVRVITPGTVTAAEALDARGNNFLAALCQGRDSFGLAVTDITTGEFRCTELAEEAALLDEIGRIQPSELLFSDRDARLRERLYKEHPAIHFTVVSDETFSNASESKLAAALTAQASDEGVRAASAILQYLETNAVDSVKLLRELEPYKASHYLVLDDGTRISLELTADYHGDRKGSLLFILDRTVTPMGARRLRQWLLYPLMDETAIRCRHEGVQELVENYGLRQELKLSLGQIQDLERLAGRTVSGAALPKDLVAIKETLRAVSQTRRLLFRSGEVDRVIGATAVRVQHHDIAGDARRQEPRRECKALRVLRDHQRGVALRERVRGFGHGAKSSRITRAVAFAEFTTPGTPAPGCVPAPTRYNPGIDASRLCGRNHALWVSFGAQLKAAP